MKLHAVVQQLVDSQPSDRPFHVSDVFNRAVEQVGMSDALLPLCMSILRRDCESLGGGLFRKRRRSE